MVIQSVSLGIKLHQESNKGFTLIEALVSIAIFAAIGVALMLGLSTSYKNLDISQERTYAESLAKSQIECIRAQDYISVINYDPYDPGKSYGIIDVPTDLTAMGYSIEINAPEIVNVAGVSGYELQSITVKVNHHEDTELTVIFYRAGLAL
jgi:prepilin-type N-terminal cleavage/methylation domain-containing protein